MNINNTDYNGLKKYFNKLNFDKTHFTSSNDICTDINCIEEMHSKIPIEVWNRKNLKILDPCGGNGNFHLVNLNYIKKYNNFNNEYIMNNILFYNDLNNKRINNYKKIFQTKNISNQNFLEFTSIDKYDIVNANPPYASIIYDEEKKEYKRSSKNHNLINKFLDKSLNLLKPNGYLVFIIPNNWMSFSDRNKLIKTLTKYQFIHLDIGSAKKKYFKGVGSSFTWFVLKKTPYYQNIQISGEYRNYIYNCSVESQIRNFIPLIYNNTIKSILNKTIDYNNEKFGIETTSFLHHYTKKENIKNEKDSVFKYKLIHTKKQTVYSNIKHKYQDGYKVFITLTDNYDVFIDNCGMTQSIAFIRCETLKEAEKIQKILTHDLYKFLNNICRFGNFNNIRILQNFPKINDYNNIYKELNINDNEIDEINKILKLFYSSNRKKIDITTKEDFKNNLNGLNITNIKKYLKIFKIKIKGISKYKKKNINELIKEIKEKI